MRFKLFFVAVGVLGMALAPLAQADLVDFESDATGAKPNGFTSDDSSVIHFSDSLGSDLDVAEYGIQGDGRSLAVNSDDPSYLIMDFDVLVCAISLDFGNDDPGWANVGDLAILTLFNGATQVGQVSVGMNANDLMDQSIAYSGAAFNQATFFYDITNPNRTGLIEIVDNIEFRRCGDPVPEPASMTLMALGLAGMAARRLRRK